MTNMIFSSGLNFKKRFQNSVIPRKNLMFFKSAWQSAYDCKIILTKMDKNDFFIFLLSVLKKKMTLEIKLKDEK